MHRALVPPNLPKQTKKLLGGQIWDGYCPTCIKTILPCVKPTQALSAFLYTVLIKMQQAPFEFLFKGCFKHADSWSELVSFDSDQLSMMDGNWYPYFFPLFIGGLSSLASVLKAIAHLLQRKKTWAIGIITLRPQNLILLYIFCAYKTINSLTNMYNSI